MKRLSPLLLVLCTFWGISDNAAENYYAFPSFPQTIVAEFATSADAADAAMTLCPLPDGKKIAFAVRGDDTNTRHLALSKLLSKYGFKLGVLLNGFDDNFANKFGREILKQGGSLGNHTLNHPFLPNLLPNTIHEQIVIHQARIESGCDTVSVSFTLPFTVADSPADPNAVRHIAEALRRAGLFISAERNFYNLPKEEYFEGNRTKWFSGADQNPLPEEMEKIFQLSKTSALKDPDYRRISYGTHTNYKPEGYANLEKWLQRHQNDADLWPCNENEYGAYRYSVIHAAPQSKIDGKTLTVTLNRYLAADLGSAIPLSATFNKQPVKVTVAGVDVAPDAQKIYHLPAMGTVPAKIDWIHDGLGESGKFPGIATKMEFSADTNTLVLTLTNNTAGALENLAIAAKIPPVWAKGVHRTAHKSLAAGASQRFTFKLGAKATDQALLDGNWHFLTRMDFTANASAGRVYTDLLHANPVKLRDCPRDRAMLVGPLDNSVLSEEVIAKLSDPSAPVKNFGTKANETWDTWNFQDVGYREFVVNAKMRNEHSPEWWKWWKQVEKFFTKPHGLRVLIMDFTAPAAGKAVVLCPMHKGNLTHFYLNGEKLAFRQKNRWVAYPDVPITVKAGKNRLVFVNPITSNWAAQQFGMPLRVYPQGEGADPAKDFRPVAINIEK